jgi:hypothetical protein
MKKNEKLIMDKKLSREELRGIRGGFEGNCSESCGQVSCKSTGGDCSRDSNGEWINCDGKFYAC